MYNDKRREGVNVLYKCVGCVLGVCVLVCVWGGGWGGGGGGGGEGGGGGGRSKITCTAILFLSFLKLNYKMHITTYTLIHQ